MLSGWRFVSREVIMNIHNMNEKVSREVGRSRERGGLKKQQKKLKHKDKIVKKK